MSACTAFYIGARAVSTPFTTVPDQPPVDMVVMKPCVCCGFNSLDADSEIPQASLAASGLSEEEVRDAMKEVSDVLKRRTCCCWRWGFCGPIMCFIWWLDMCTQQCKCGLTKCCCQDPALREIDEVLEEHSQKLQSKGVKMSRLASGIAAVTQSLDDTGVPLILVRSEHKVYFDTWLIQVAYGGAR
eukprot:CAMPEP_0197879014 /NCGR_PEP_ID=MMETSP1439-20131203/7236_1 /TAXON_ID=66791 /ORGANISM="Gonyaulax spinifera, Strain CCMP409" /LENGTH=185 /DNA_ID=CAMNT_0043498489 /DNA_START=111 /DNA_END=668 /DNA_ORIENTATION=-